MKKLSAFFLVLIMVCSNVCHAEIVDEANELSDPYFLFDFEWFGITYENAISYFAEAGIQNPEYPIFVAGDIGCLFERDSEPKQICISHPEQGEALISKLYLWYGQSANAYEDIVRELVHRFGKEMHINEGEQHFLVWRTPLFVIKLFATSGNVDDSKKGNSRFTILVQSQKDYWQQAFTDQDKETESRKEFNPKEIKKQEKVTTPALELIVRSNKILDELVFSAFQTNGLAHSLYKSQTNAAYVTLQCDIKNLCKTTMSYEAIDGIVSINGYEYNLGIFAAQEFVPLSVVNCYIYALVPNELVEQIKNGEADVVFYFGYNDDLSWTGIVGEYKSCDNQFYISFAQ